MPLAPADELAVFALTFALAVVWLLLKWRFLR